MNQRTSVHARTVSGTRGVQELIEAYAEAHNTDVWYWERIDDSWVLAAATSKAPSNAPGTLAASIPGLSAPESCVEVPGPDAERSRFLATVLGGLLKNQSDSRLMGRELAERYEEITLLYTISEVLGSVISLEKAAETILAEVIDTMGVQRAALWIYDSEIEQLELVASVGGDTHVGPIPIGDPSSITAAVFRDRRSTILEMGDVYPRETDLAASWNLDSFLSVPVSYTPPHGESRTIGVINLIGRTIEDRFSAGDQKLITAIASQIGAAVENSRLVAESLSQERIGREMELAHDLQLKLLPSTAQFEGYAQVAARCLPADSVGGDFYHLFKLPGGRMGVMIGDVSSHGFAAALIMALTMSAVAIHASEGDPPAAVLRRLHQALISELESTEMYLTLFYGVIDPAKKTITFANAGHSHAFRISATGTAERLPATNPPFGIVDLNDYRELTIEWTPGEDLLFLFTDGLSDAISPANGEEILVNLASEGRSLPFDELIAAVFAVAGNGSDVPSDDRTAVLVRV